MDTLSHALWGYGLFGFRGRPWLALFFGAFPDLVSFGLLIVFRILSGTWEWGKPDMETIPTWLFPVYDFAHSLIIAAAAVLIFWFWKRSVGFAMGAWVWHILLDIPFHSKAYFPTKMFWPASGYAFDGIPWSTPGVWYSNVAGIIFVFWFRFHKKRHRELRH